MSEPTRFMVLGTQRSGTTLVTSTFKRYPNVTAFDEVFLASRKADFTYRNYVSQTRLRWIRHCLARTGMVREYLDQLLRPEQEQIEAIGFKIMYDQLGCVPYRYPSVLEYACDNALKVIHVIRSNVLRIVLSKLLARQRQLFHTTDEAIPKFESIHIDPTWLIREMDMIRRKQDLWRTRIASFIHLEINYEDFIASKEERTWDLLDFIGIESSEFLFSNLKKISPNDIQDIIDNYDEIAQVLSGTSYHEFLAR